MVSQEGGVKTDKNSEHLLSSGNTQKKQIFSILQKKGERWNYLLCKENFDSVVPKLLKSKTVVPKLILIKTVVLN